VQSVHYTNLFWGENNIANLNAFKKKRYALPSQKTRRVRVHLFFPFVKFFSWPLEKNTTKTEQESWKKNGKKKHFFFVLPQGLSFYQFQCSFSFFFTSSPSFTKKKNKKKGGLNQMKSFAFPFVKLLFVYLNA